MTEPSQHLESIQDIKQMMEKSSRFISLSGLSGIAAGLCALVAAWIAREKVNQFGPTDIYFTGETGYGYMHVRNVTLESELIIMAVITFAVAFFLAFVFTYLRSKKTGVPIWGYVARKVMFNVAIPMIAGGLMIWRMTELGYYGLIAPASLIFYGLALINSSKFTFPEIRYLGFGQLFLGVLNLWMIGYGLTFWAIGFGVLHIIYGFLMWWKNERNTVSASR